MEGMTLSASFDDFSVDLRLGEEFRGFGFDLTTSPRQGNGEFKNGRFIVDVRVDFPPLTNTRSPRATECLYMS